MAGETYQGGYGIGKPNSHIVLPVALMKEKCSSTRPTHLAIGKIIACHPDAEQTRPTKSPGPVEN